MKYIILTTLFLLGCGGSNEDAADTKYKQAYYDCYYESQEFFKKISKIDFKDLKVEDNCNEDTTFLDNPKDEVCLKACIDAFNHYK